MGARMIGGGSLGYLFYILVSTAGLPLAILCFVLVFWRQIVEFVGPFLEFALNVLLYGWFIWFCLKNVI